MTRTRALTFSFFASALTVAACAVCISVFAQRPSSGVSSGVPGGAPAPIPTPSGSALPQANVHLEAPPHAEPEAVQPALDRALKVRDPFKQPNLVTGKKAVSELESIPVENFVLVGVMTGPLKTKALVSASAGKTYFITEGTKIGTRKGVVRRIDPSEILIREHVMNYLGTEEVSDVKITPPTRAMDPVEAEIIRLQAGGSGGAPGAAANANFGVGAAWMNADILSGNTVVAPPNPYASTLPLPPAVPNVNNLPALSPGAGSTSTGSGTPTNTNIK